MRWRSPSDSGYRRFGDNLQSTATYFEDSKFLLMFIYLCWTVYIIRVLLGCYLGVYTPYGGHQFH
ncbi:hypothetical protein BDV06DRAFT_208107 [Aspergillus oleicola]